MEGKGRGLELDPGKGRTPGSQPSLYTRNGAREPRGRSVLGTSLFPFRLGALLCSADSGARPAIGILVKRRPSPQFFPYNGDYWHSH